VTAVPDPATRRGFLGAGASAALALGAAGPARAADRPNVIVIVVDTLRADHVYGDRARTPNMDALRREGISFTRAYPEALPTVPVRNTLLSGRRQFPFRGWHDWRGLLDSPGWAPLTHVRSSWTSALRRAGYFTAYVTDNPFLGYSLPYRPLRHSFHRFVRTGGEIGGRRTGVSRHELRHWMHPALHHDAKAFERMRRYLSNGRYSHDETHSFAARVFANGALMLSQAATRRPFALVVDTYEPHEPWTPPRKYINLYGDPDHRGPEPGMPRYGKVDKWSRGDASALVSRMHALYAAEVTMTDRWLGFFLDHLHDLGLERDTAIVLVGDHGFMFGEYGYTGKISSELHPVLMRVPLVVVDPARRRAGRASDYLAQTHDVAPTLLSLAGVRAPRDMTGHDLSPLFERRRPRERKLAYGGYANSMYVRTRRWKLITDNRGHHKRLYDLAHDPDETHNVAHRHPARAAAMYDAVARRAGGRPPYYTNSRA
jgi:arylsulfatase A-like enzyme